MTLQRFCLRGLIIGGMVLLGGCGGDGSENQYLAKVNDDVLTYDMIRSRLDTTTAIEPQVRQIIQNWVNNELLYQEARKRGYENVPAVTQPLEEIKHQLAVNVLLQKDIYEKVVQAVPAEEIQRYYETHKPEFLLKEDKVKLSYIAFANRDAATSFRTEIAKGTSWFDALTRIASSKDVLESVDSLLFTQSTLSPAELWRVLQMMNPKEVSFPVKTPVGIYVLYLQGRQLKGETASVDFVRNDIRQRVVMEKRQQGVDSLLAELRRKNSVQMNLSIIPQTGEAVQQ